MGIRLLFVLFAKETAEQPVVLDGFQVLAELLAADAEVLQGALKVISGLLVVEEHAHGRILVVEACARSA